MSKYELLPPLSDDEFEALKNDIAANGVRQPIIVDENGDILDGHHRYKICPTVERIVLAGKTEAQKKAFVFNANLTRRNLSAAQKKAAAKQQKKIAAELALDGSTQQEIAAMLGVAQNTVSVWLGATNIINDNGCRPDVRVKIPKTEHPKIYEQARDGKTQEQIAANYGVTRQAVSKIIDKIEQQALFDSTVETVDNLENTEVTDSVTVTSGEWWSLGGHLLYCGDTSSDEFISKIDEAAMAFADPPYGVNKAGWDKAFYWQHDYLIDKAKVVAVTPGIASVFEFAKLTAMPYVWSLACWIDNGMTRGAVGFGNWIYIALFSNDSVFAQKQDVIRVSIKNSESDKTIHESRKPSDLLVTLLQYYTQENDFVIDPFLGSGTTLFACEEMGRVCVGGELKPEYCEEIIARWEKQTGGKAQRLLI